MISAKKEEKGVRVGIGGIVDDIVDELAYATYSMLSNCRKETSDRYAKIMFADLICRVRSIYLTDNDVDLFDINNGDALSVSGGYEGNLDSLARMVLDGMSESVIGDEGMEDDLPNFFS